jgi:hypothetical protein
MKIPNLVLLAVSLSIVTAAGAGPVLEFPQKSIDLPPLLLADAARQEPPAVQGHSQAWGRRPGLFEVALDRLLAPDEHKFGVIPPRDDVDYKLIIIKPDSSIDFKLIVKETGPQK